MDSLNDYTTKTPESQGEERENLYEFDVGRVRLDWRRAPARFYAIVDNVDMMAAAGLPEEAHRNPYIATTYFVQGVSSILRGKIKKLLEYNGFNAVTGCMVDMPCEECRRQGLNDKKKGCVRYGGDSG